MLGKNFDLQLNFVGWRKRKPIAGCLARFVITHFTICQLSPIESSLSQKYLHLAVVKDLKANCSSG